MKNSYNEKRYNKHAAKRGKVDLETASKIDAKARKHAQKAGAKSGLLSGMVGASTESNRAYKQSVKGQGYKINNSGYIPGFSGPGKMKKL